MEIMESCVPPGFRFHPTEEELVGYYLKRKIDSLKIDLDVIIDIDLYKMEPWDIQDRCKLGYDEQTEWYFFSHKDRKYPTGTRTNRATTAGFWKATGRDKAVLSKNRIIGMRKTLVFYKGRAPNGRKTDWIMHEYRLQTTQLGPPQEEGWVVCRAFKKPIPNQRPGYEAWNQPYYVNNTSYLRPPSYSDNTDSTSSHHYHPIQTSNFNQNFASQSHQDQHLLSNHTFLDTNTNNNNNNNNNNNHVMEIPQLDSPTGIISTSFVITKQGINDDGDDGEERSNNGSQYIDWKNLDALLASQVNDPIPSIPQNYDLQTQSHFLGYFPDS